MNFATAVGPEVETPRDAPNVPADRQALTLVKRYQGMVAWPTVLVAVGIVVAFALVCRSRPCASSRFGLG